MVPATAISAPTAAGGVRRVLVDGAVAGEVVEAGGEHDIGLGHVGPSVGATADLDRPVGGVHVVLVSVLVAWRHADDVGHGVAVVLGVNDHDWAAGVGADVVGDQPNSIDRTAF